MATLPVPPQAQSVLHAASVFAQRLVSIDLEVEVKDQKIRELGAARTDGQTLHLKNMFASAAWLSLEDFCKASEILVGHNLIEFDLKHLAKHSPHVTALKMPVLDTLWLSPLAFPANPYHKLIKHYQHPQLLSSQINNPLADAQLVLQVVQEEFVALHSVAMSNPSLVAAWHGLAVWAEPHNGFGRFFAAVRKQDAPTAPEVLQLLRQLLSNGVCSTFVDQDLHLHALQDISVRWSWAYALSWLQVSGSNSVMPPWVRNQFPMAPQLVQQLRNTPCNNPACSWCRTQHDAVQELQHWFPHLKSFRAEPANAQGRSLQQVIVETTMQSKHLLAILPTGAGKSVCYQVPALSRFFKTGALTLVISPLVALMEDQVANLRKQGITACAAMSGLLSMTERKDVLNRIKLGDIGILLLAPEQLRNSTVRKAIEQREIGGWVLDEAHCLSKWGHDFRPDYRYVGRFIKQQAGNNALPPILCLTATAKPDVIKELEQYFLQQLGVELLVENGGAHRHNLAFEVVHCQSRSKINDLLGVLRNALDDDAPGAAIVYCATRKSTEKVVQLLQQQGWSANFFHGGMEPNAKKTVQGEFLGSTLRVMVATNAFGMGIDKPDVRLVVHFDMPGSLENYFQEAGRAGRDSQAARCILLYAPEDVEKQFGLNALARLNTQDIQAILKIIRKIDRKKRRDGEVVVTPGEILKEDEDALFYRVEDRATDDTRVKTAVTWLEESALLQRLENVVSVYPSSLKIKSMQEALEKLQRYPKIANPAALLKIVSVLINSNPANGINTDELMAETGLSNAQIRNAMHDLEHMGICNNDLALTVFVNTSPQNCAQKKLLWWLALEKTIIATLRIEAPDMGRKLVSDLNLRKLTQWVKNDSSSQDNVHTDMVRNVLQALVDDGRRSSKHKTIKMYQRGDILRVTLLADWKEIAQAIELRSVAASLILAHLLGRTPSGSRTDDVLVKTSASDLIHCLQNDIGLKSKEFDPVVLTERVLLWLHGLEIVRLNKGLSVYRSAMTLQLSETKKGFTRADFEPLEMHYREQVEQIHIMMAYAEKGKEQMNESLELARDYFALSKEAFVKRWFPQNSKELERETSPMSYMNIVDSLGSPTQKEIVKDDREKTSVLVLAGPGSGKTRILVHRIAYLVRVRRCNPQSILALAYNRHAAAEIRRRLQDLIANDAVRVMVMTCHALAMRLVGVSFEGGNSKRQGADFDKVLVDAVALLKGEGLAPEAADEQRERLLAGFRWILVDEYQDIGEKHYALISALAGRTANDPEQKISLFAVGDDDQNIYAFNGANVKYIKQFESDYDAKASYLIENYRSTAHIIDAANAVIVGAAERMKQDHNVQINKARAKKPPGGKLEQLDATAKGKVHLLEMPVQQNFDLQQAVAVVDDMVRLSRLLPDWNWSQAAVIAREWKFLSPVRSYCEHLNIPVQMGDENFGSVWRLRETQALVHRIRSHDQPLLELRCLEDELRFAAQSPWNTMLLQGLESFKLETGFKSTSADILIDWLAEWGGEFRRQQNGLLLVSAHRAKGLEFEHVAVLGGNWTSKKDEPGDELRRLFYVAMTRAKSSLTLAASMQHPFFNELTACAAVHRSRVAVDGALPAAVSHYYDIAQLNEVDLGFAGRLHDRDAAHAAIERLAVGSPLVLQLNGEKYTLRDADGQHVGTMAKSYKPPANGRFLHACVYAMHTRWRSDAVPPYDLHVKVDQWYVVVPEIVFSV